MSEPEPLHVGYVVKRYPRYSETFIVNEILAHEARGLRLAIFSLLPPNDAIFQDIIARVRTPVTYVTLEWLRAVDLWTALMAAKDDVPNIASALEVARGVEVRDVYAALRLARAARDLGIHHLHAHFGSSATTVTRLAARFAGLTYSFTAHAKDIFHESVQDEDMRRKLTDAAAVITVSDFNCAHLRAVYGSAAAGVCRIYNGLDLAHFPYRGPAERPPRIVAVGRLVEKKGFADLVEACALLAGRGRLFRCEIIGGGDLQPDLCSQIERLGLTGLVEMLGPLPQSEVIRHVQGAAALAAPCVVGRNGDRDGLPTVLLEAMALGTPCVSTDVTGIPELVRHEETGLLVAQRDPAGLAAALERLLVDPGLRVELAAEARRLIEAEFDIHRNTAQLRAVFHEAVGLGPALRDGALREVS